MMEIIEELMESSFSSSSDDDDFLLYLSSSDDDEFITMQCALFETTQKNRIRNFVNDVVAKYSVEEFRCNFRVSRITANKLIEKYANSAFYKNNKGERDGVTAETQCLAFLWFAGNKETYRKVAKRFSISKSAAEAALTNFLEFLFDISAQHIRFPSTDGEKLEKSKEFEQLAGFPNVIGCIDLCHINIRKPAHKLPSKYVNENGTLRPITLQGICDANKKFLDAFIASPCKMHDSLIYDLSFISKKIPQICDEQYHILGDARYRLREYLLTPFKDSDNYLTTKRSNYNEKHRQTKVKIENAFQILKQRFRQLNRLDFFEVQRMCKFVLGCCVLHNLCIEDGDLWVEYEMHSEKVPAKVTLAETTQNMSEVDENAEPLSETILKHRGDIKRIIIAEAF